MVRQQQEQRPKWTPLWSAAACLLTSAAVAEVEQLRLIPMSWWALPFLAGFGAFITALFGWGRWWPRTQIFQVCAWGSAGGWTTLVSVADWSWWAVLIGVGCALTFAGAARHCQTPTVEPSPAAVQPAAGDWRPRHVREWEALLRHLTRKDVTVTDIVPWDKRRDGVRIHVDLPVGAVPRDLTEACTQIATARHLPQGCNVRILDGAHQGEVVIDVMLRDCLADPVVVPTDYTRASIYDPFAVMYTPRGEPLDMCLREQSMVVGGAPGSGKTTLLHRLILRLARCEDALIWVMDPNGGGVAEPWIGPWARSEAGAPVVDWVADDEASAAVMVAVASKIAKDRKTSPIAVGRKRKAGVMVLPVDKDLPAIVVISDEGGELRQTGNLLAQLAVAGVSRLAQIGRSEGVRVVMSILRGTADLLDKGLRVNAALRVCLRMEEEDEYAHVLGAHPGSTRLIHTGSGYVRRSTDQRPVFSRSADLSRGAIEAAAVALAPLRPSLDERGRQVAAKVRVRDVLDGRDPGSFPDIAGLAVMRDVEVGRAYEGRWDRYAHKLAEMRGEELSGLEDDEPTSGAPVAGPPTAVAGRALADLEASFGLTPASVPVVVPPPSPQSPAPGAGLSDAAVDQAADVLLAELDAPKLTMRDHIILILGDVYPEMLTCDQLGVELERRTGNAGNRTHRQNLLGDMAKRSQILRVAESANDGRYTLPRAPQR